METATQPRTTTKRVQKLVLTREEVLEHFPKGLKIAEVGVYRGAYSKKIITTQPSEFHLIDCWQFVDDDTDYSKLDGCNDNNEKHEKNFQWVRRMFKDNPEVKFIRDFSGPASKKFENASLDAVYIDGDHTYEGCLSDLRDYSAKVKKDGFIWGHDYTHTYDWIDVPRAIETFLSENPDWSLHCITAEKPRKSPSWFLVQENSIIKAVLDKIEGYPTPVTIKN